MPKTKGRYTQRQLVPIMVELIDAASAAGKTAHRDIARTELRRVLREENWQTPFIWNNLAPKRCRYIAGLGHPVPSRWLFREYDRGVSKDPWLKVEDE